MVRKTLIVVVAVVAIAAALYVGSRGCRRVVRRGPTDEAKYWVMLSMGGRYVCPHCGKKVELTDEQRRQPKPPPDFACPHCKKAVDVVELMAPRPAAKGNPPGKRP